MTDANVFSGPFSRNRQVSVRYKFSVLSSVLFLSILVAGGAAFFSLMERTVRTNASSELMRILEREQVELEASVKGEIALVLNMAGSSFVRRYFINPQDPERKALFFEDIDGYRQAFQSNSLFWINDIDRQFHFTDAAAYTVDPEDPVNYWYHMTLYGTERFNFNINYNPDIGVINLWINAPVFDPGRKPIGMVGTGLDLNTFIASIFKDAARNTEIYFFNGAGQITAAENVGLAENKVHIREALGRNGEEMFAAIKKLPENGGIEIFEAENRRGNIIAVCSIPSLNWYIGAVRHISIREFLPAGFTALAIFIAACFALFVLLTGLMSAQLIFRPLENLNDSVARLEGNAAERIYGLERQDEFGHLANTIEGMKNRISSIQYARRIQKNLLPKESLFKEAFPDYAILWNPRDMVGGDIYWIRNYDEGTVLCVCDCTGHGTPGAMLTMLTVTALDALVNEKNYQDPAQIIWELDQRFLATINAGAEIAADRPPARRRRGADIRDGCDLAVLYLAKDGSIALAAGNTDVLVCDGQRVTRLRGQRLQVGAGELAGKAAVRTVRLPANPGQKLYIASDGLYEQTGGERGLPLGFGAVEKLILENHGESQEAISGKIWQAFEDYRGNSIRCDDVLLISLKT